MLASASQQAELEPLAVPGLAVVLPADLKAFFYESGYQPTTAEEFRGNARLRIRSVADLLLVYTPPPIRDALAERDKRNGKVLIKDLSRSGIGILYHQQLYPEEQFQVRFQGRLLHALVVRCRRLGPLCYETGGRIVALETIAE